MSSNNIAKKIESLEKRVDKVEKRLDRVEKRLDGVERRLDRVEKRLDGVEKRLDKVVVKIIDYIDLRIEEVKQSLTGEINSLRKDFEDFKNNVYDKLDWLISQYKKLDEERDVIIYRQEKINERLDDHEVRISRLENRKNIPTS